MSKTPYEILYLEPNATTREIKSSYRVLKNLRQSPSNPTENEVLEDRAFSLIGKKKKRKKIHKHLPNFNLEHKLLNDFKYEENYKSIKFLRDQDQKKRSTYLKLGSVFGGAIIGGTIGFFSKEFGINSPDPDELMFGASMILGALTGMIINQGYIIFQHIQDGLEREKYRTSIEK